MTKISPQQREQKKLEKYFKKIEKDKNKVLFRSDETNRMVSKRGVCINGYSKRGFSKNILSVIKYCKQMEQKQQPAKLHKK